MDALIASTLDQAGPYAAFVAAVGVLTVCVRLSFKDRADTTIIVRATYEARLEDAQREIRRLRQDRDADRQTWADEREDLQVKISKLETIVYGRGQTS